MRERRYAPLGVTTDHETRILALEAAGTEVNDLTAAVTWANVPDANITQSSVTQHEAALTLTEAQVEAALSGITAFTVGNYVFNTDQTVGAGQDNYVLTYDNATGEIGLEAAAGGGLANVVEDTTPQLGGALDVNGQTIDFADNEELRFGTGNDVLIDFDATNFVIAGTGNFNISGFTQMDFGGADIDNVDAVFMLEQSADKASVATFGQWWVKNDAPNRPYFTDDGDSAYPLGFAKWLNVSEDAADTIDWQYMNGIAFKDGTTPITYTLEASGVTTFEVGSNTTFINANATGDITINEGTGTTLYLLDGSAVTDTAGGCTLAGGGYATLYRHSATVYYIMGAGLTA